MTHLSYKFGQELESICLQIWSG